MNVVYFGATGMVGQGVIVNALFDGCAARCLGREEPVRISSMRDCGSLSPSTCLDLSSIAQEPTAGARPEDLKPGCIVLRDDGGAIHQSDLRVHDGGWKRGPMVKANSRNDVLTVSGSGTDSSDGFAGVHEMRQPKAKSVGLPTLPKGHAKRRVLGLRLHGNDFENTRLFGCDLSPSENRSFQC